MSKIKTSNYKCVSQSCSHCRQYFRFNITGEFYSMRDVGGWNGSNAYPYQFASQRHGYQDNLLTRQQADESFSRGELEVQTEWNYSRRILTSLMLTQHESRSGEWWPEVRPVRVKSVQNHQGPIFFCTARASKFDKFSKTHELWPFPWKPSVWQNSYQERTKERSAYLAK